MADPIRRQNPMDEPKKESGVISAVQDKARDFVSGTGDFVTQAKDKAQQWASTAADKASDVVGDATSAVTDRVSAAASYVREHDWDEIGKDVTGLIRRYPLPSILIGLAAGFLLARATSRD